MDDLDIFLAEQMKNERFKKSYMSAKKELYIKESTYWNNIP